MANNIILPLHYAGNKVLTLVLPAHKIRDISSHPDPHSSGTVYQYTVTVRRGMYIADNIAKKPEQLLCEIARRIIADADAIIEAADRMDPVTIQDITIETSL